jgi:hypothetical protein
MVSDGVSAQAPEGGPEVLDVAQRLLKVLSDEK